MKIKTRIQVSITLCIVLTVTISLFVFMEMHEMHDKSREAKIASIIVKDMAELNIATHEYLLHPGERPLIQWKSKYDSLANRLTSEENKFDSPEENISLNKIHQNLVRLGTVFSKLTADFGKERGLDRQKDPISSELQDRLIGELLIRSQATISPVFHLQKVIHDEIEVAQKRYSFLISIFLVVFMFLIVGILIWINKSIARPIIMLEEGIQIVGTGNLSHKVGTEAKDEIGTLSRSFDKMTEDLKKSTTSIVDLNKEIVERKLAEEELSEKTLWLNSMFHALEEAVFIAGPDQKLVDINSAAEKILGYTKDELYNLSTEILHVDHEHFLEFGRRLKKDFDKGETASFEFKAKRKNGEIFPTEHNISLLKKDDGTHLGIVGVLRDTTQRKQAEETLRESERMQGVLEMAGAICHEFNQPLMAISGFSQLLQMNISQDDPSNEKITKIVEQIEKLGGITRKLMNITSYETKEYLESKIVDLDKSSKQSI